MRKTLLLFSFFGFISVIYGKLGFFNDYTRPLQWNEDFSDEDYKKIEDFVNYLRKRAEAAEAASQDSGPFDENPSFVYSLPNAKPKDPFNGEFAVGPSDPRYYQGFGKPPESVQESVITPKNTDSDGSLQAIEVTSRADGSPEKDVSDEGDQNPSHSAVYQSPVSDVIEADDRSDMYFTAIVAGCSAAAVFAVVAIGISCYRGNSLSDGKFGYRRSRLMFSSVKDYLGTLKGSFDNIRDDLLQKNAKAAAEVDYPAYGVTGPHKDASPTSGDRRLAQSAQMYHYQHQKQQIIAMESRASNDRHGSISDAESDEENEEGDYTVYECPGLASTGEMEVKNPLFQDDQTPATPVKAGTQQSKPAQDLHK